MQFPLKTKFERPNTSTLIVKAFELLEIIVKQKQTKKILELHHILLEPYKIKPP